MKQVWQIDPEFRRLSVPLSSEKERRLENSLVREGCKEPIAGWHGCILDGHKRYEICSYEEIEYETVEMDFSTKDEAIFWAERAKVAALPRDSTAYRYLAGKVYLSVKTLVCNHKWESVSSSEQIDLSVKDCGGRISELTARVIGSNRTVIDRFARFARDMDLIAEKDHAVFEAILSGKIEITYAKATELAKMDSAKLANIRRRLLREKDVKMRQRKPRQRSADGSSGKTQQEQAAPLEMGIKEMPMFDPDMEFRGLALTIPTWMNAIARTRAKTDIDLVSEPTKAQLAVILRRLEEQITQTLEVIEK